LGVKNKLRFKFGPTVDRWYRLVYNIVAVVTLLPLLPMLALLPDTRLYVAPLPWRWVMSGGQLLALAGLALSFLQTNPWHFMGLAQLWQPTPNTRGQLVTHGFYSRVRHPLYFFSLLLLWLAPAMTVNTFTAYLLFTLYFYIGSVFEERRLLAEFGPVYRAYQRQVPRLIPWPGRQARLTQNPEQPV
jgi:protein-S-isoprenylcysteine O-methyltransferase Ste14